MRRFNKQSLFLFFSLSFFYMFPRIVTLIAYVMHLELPIRITLITLFPVMVFVTPVIAAIYSKHVKNIKLVFIACFLSIVAWEFLYLVFIGSIAYVSQSEIIRILLLAFSLGFIGASEGLNKGKAKFEAKYGLMILGMTLWFIIFSQGIIRWFALLTGGPIPN